jgi:hypothetical protein
MVNRPGPTNLLGAAMSSLGPAILQAYQAHQANKAAKSTAPIVEAATSQQFQPQAPGTGFTSSPVATMGEPAFSGIQAPTVNAGQFQVPQIMLQNKLNMNPFASMINQYSPWGAR